MLVPSLLFVLARLTSLLAGLEIASLLALCHFIDHLFPADSTSASPAPSPALASSTAAAAPSPPLARITSRLRPSPPLPPQPPRPPPQRRQSSLTTLATNEIEVTDTSEPTLDAHCARCLDLLEVRALALSSLLPSPARRS